MLLASPSIWYTAMLQFRKTKANCYPHLTLHSSMETMAIQTHKTLTAVVVVPPAPDSRIPISLVSGVVMGSLAPLSTRAYCPSTKQSMLQCCIRRIDCKSIPSSSR